MGYDLQNEILKRVEKRKKLKKVVTIFFAFCAAAVAIVGFFEIPYKGVNLYQELFGKKEDEKAKTAKLQGQIAGISKCKEYIDRFDDLLNGEQTQLGLFVDTESEDGQGKQIRDRNDPPGYFGLITSKIEREQLLNRQLNMFTMLHKQFWDA